MNTAHRFVPNASASLLLHRGREQLRAGACAAAVGTLGEAVRALPHSPEAQGALANALARTGRFEDAVTAHERAVTLSPTTPELWSDLASTYLRFGRAEAAVEGFRMALRLAPRRADLHYNLGTALLLMGDLPGAEDALRRAVGFAPDHAGALVNLGATLRRSGAADDAMAVLGRAVEVAPDNADAQWNLALASLMSRPTADGWARYEWRLRRDGQSGIAGRADPGTTPDWAGDPRPDATLLLTSEQGLGDTVQFLRFALAARERVGRVVLESPPALARLLRGVAGVDEIVPHGQSLPRCDLRAPLMSLPHRLGLPVPPSDDPYVRPEDERVARWSARLEEAGLGPGAGLRVAIGWQGNPAYEDDARRSLPLVHFATLARVPGVRLVSVQKMHGLEQLAGWPADLPIVDLGPELDEGPDAFVDTAAVLGAVDLVVTSDTALAHVAGATGVPARVLLSHAPDWRWGLSGSTSPWYGAMRLVRQSRPGDWGGPMREVAAELAARADTEVP